MQKNGLKLWLLVFVTVALSWLNFQYPIAIELSIHKLYIYIGMVPLLVIAMGWGWRAGLGTVALVSVSTFFLYLHTGGSVAVIPFWLMYLVWFGVHGYCAERREAGDDRLLYQPYLVELIFSLSYISIIVLVWPTLYRVFPPDWGPSGGLNRQIMYGVLFMTTLNRLVALALADGMLLLPVMRRWIGLPTDDSRKDAPYVVGGFLFLGWVLWQLDALTESQLRQILPGVVYPEYYFSGEMVRRILLVVVCLIAGNTIARLFQRRRLAESKARERGNAFRTIFEKSPHIVLIQESHTGKIIDGNQAFCALIGVEGKNIAGKLPEELGIAFPWPLCSEVERIRDLDVMLSVKEGTSRHLNISIEPIVLRGILCCLIMAKDVTERRMAAEEQRRNHEELQSLYQQLQAADQALRMQHVSLQESRDRLEASEERYRLAMEGARDALWNWDINGNMMEWSGRVGDMVGKAPLRVQGWHGMDAFIHPEDRDRRWQAMEDHLAGITPHYECEFRMLTEQDNYCWVLSRGKASFDKQGRVIRVAGSYTDISEQKKREERMQYLAYYDSLTGLPNRVMIQQKLMEMALGEKPVGWLVVCLDIDNFKTVNDALGPNAGDELLIKVAERLRGQCTDASFIGRLAGDEFMMLWQREELDRAEAVNILEEVQMQFQLPLIMYDREFHITVSMGAVVCFGSCTQGENVLRNADVALHEAKAAGKNCYRFFDDAMQQRIAERMKLGASLRTAVERQEMSVHYQPLVSPDGCNFVGIEALARWNSPVHGRVAPDQFIPLAEEAGLILPIGLWVMEKACRFANLLRVEWGREIPVAVNISVRQLQDKDFVPKLRAVLKRTELPPDQLELEVTESIFIRETEYCVTQLEAIAQMGVRISLDDFGTGYSSLAQLYQLPIHTLKIDRSFIWNMEKGGERTKDFVRKIIQLAHILNLTVVAEGVETEEQLLELRKMNADRIQGYLVGKPMLPEELVTWMERYSSERDKL